MTGLGPISSIGLGRDQFTESLQRGRSGARPISRFDVSGFKRTIGCEVTTFEPDLQRLSPADFGRAAQFAVTAARLALADGLLGEAELRTRPGLVSMGTTDGESADIDALVHECVTAPDADLDGDVVRRVPAGWLSRAVALDLDLELIETLTVTTACAAGNYAIGYAFDALQSGEIDYALCGGVDAMCRKTFAGFTRLGAVAAEQCRPFDAERDGILTGEGSGVLLLETLAGARARGVEPYAEVLGYGLTCDARHPVAPDRDRIARCMSVALERAQLSPESVDLISAHGTGTRANDVTEVGAIHQVYGAAPPPVVSLKSMLGHTMGAASALAAIACVIALREGFIPPTINHHETEPGLDIDCVPNVAREADLRIVQNNGLAFGGNNAVVMLGRVDQSPSVDE